MTFGRQMHHDQTHKKHWVPNWIKMADFLLEWQSSHFTYWPTDYRPPIYRGPIERPNFYRGFYCVGNVAPIEKKVWQWQKHALVYWFILSSGVDQRLWLSSHFSEVPPSIYTTKPPNHLISQPSCLFIFIYLLKVQLQYLFILFF